MGDRVKRPAVSNNFTVLNDTDICFDSGLAEPGCSFSSAQRTPTSPSPGIVEGDSVFFKSNLPYNDVSDSMYQQFDLLSSPSQSPINNDKIGASLMVDDEEPIDQTLDRTNNNNSPTIKHYYKSVKQDSPILVFQPKLSKCIARVNIFHLKIQIFLFDKYFS